MKDKKLDVLAEIKQVISETVKVNFKNNSFLLKVDVNEDPKKKGIKVQFLPTTFGTISPTEQNDIAIALGDKLDSGLRKFGMSVERDRQLKNKSIIGFFIYIEYFDKIVRSILKGQDELQPQEDEQQNDK
jgi:hypothetical protein